MHAFYIILIAGFYAYQSNAQTSNQSVPIGGPCEGCEAIYEYGDQKLHPTDTLLGFEMFEERLKVTGTVFYRNGKTPASDVIVYLYHTNPEGLYEAIKVESGWGNRHGSLRGWIKTGLDGRYTFYTSVPGSYPNRSTPQHIHMTIKEPHLNEYYISDIFFHKDPLLTDVFRSEPNPRGGSGITDLVQEDGLLIARRDIILGLNIPNYPN